MIIAMNDKEVTVVNSSNDEAIFENFQKEIHDSIMSRSEGEISLSNLLFESYNVTKDFETLGEMNVVTFTLGDKTLSRVWTEYPTLGKKERAFTDRILFDNKTGEILATDYQHNFNENFSSLEKNEIKIVKRALSPHFI